MDDEPVTTETPVTEAPVETPVTEAPVPEPPAEPTVEVPVVPPQVMKVSWNPNDQDPVQTGREIRLIRVYSNVDGRQLRVMKTADAADCLHIFVDVV